MGSGDPPGLQNRRAAGILSLVGSTPTRFRQLIFKGLGTMTLVTPLSDRR
jgi:hypothetical protein